MNITLLRKVQAYLVEHPEDFEMSQWVRKTPCGTTACICGTGFAIECGSREFNRIIEASGYPPSSSISCIGGMDSFYMVEVGASLFGLTPVQANRLFFACEWPQPFQADWYLNEQEPKVRAEVAHARIEFFIATNGADVMPEPEPAPVIQEVEYALIAD